MSVNSYEDFWYVSTGLFRPRHRQDSFISGSQSLVVVSQWLFLTPIGSVRNENRDPWLCVYHLEKYRYDSLVSVSRLVFAIQISQSVASVEALSTYK